MTMTKLRYTLSLILSLLFMQGAHAQASFRAQGPDMVEAGQKFQVRFTLSNADGGRPEWPSFEGLELLYGPSTSSSSSIQIINGKTTSSSSVSYTFVLRGTKEGAYTIQPATVTANGQTYKTQPLKIQIVGNAPASQSQGGGMQQGQGQSAQTQMPKGNKNDIFITASASRTNVYEQEAILVTYKIFTRVDVSHIEGDLPTLNGFQIQKLDIKQSNQRETVNGQIYLSAVLSQYVLFPQKSGVLEIPAITYVATEIRQSRAIDPIEAFFNGVSTQEVKRNVVAPKLTIRVKALPPKPADFSGAVGKFTISSTLAPQTLKANDAVTMRIKVKGTGNMKLMETPIVAFPKDFETYDPKVADNFGITSAGYSGSKDFEYLAVPRHKGKYEIPVVNFTYFDTGSQSYKTISTDPYTLTVEKGLESNSTSVNFAGQQDVEQLANDILYIKTGDISESLSGWSFMESWTYWLWYLVAILAAMTVAVVGRRQIRENANVAKTKGKKANKVASRRLRNASKLLQKHDKDNFYDEIMRALLGYTADKLNIPLSTLNKDNIQSELQNRSVSQDLIDLFIKCLNDCEFARYAPGDPNETMENVYDGAVNAITNMESSIRKSQRHTSAAYAKVILAFVMLGASFSLYAQKKLDKAAADTLYANEQYDKAAQIYSELLKSHPKSTELYFNLGNCYFKMDSLAQSVLAFERARLLSPGDDAVNTNLEFVRSQTADKSTPHSELFFVTWWKDLSNTLSIDTWLVWALVLFVLMLAALLAYAFLTETWLRRISVALFFVTLVGTVLANLLALSQYRTMIDHDYAIITAPAVSVKSTPSETSTDLFIIHEGTKVRITDDSMKDWAEVVYEDGKQGWMPKSDFEVI